MNLNTLLFQILRQRLIIMHINFINLYEDKANVFISLFYSLLQFLQIVKNNFV